MTLRRTKIVATLGPVTDDDKVLTAMLQAGVNVARLNFSHGTRDEQRKRVGQLRRIAKKAGRAVAIIGDLGGPKIRIECFRDGKVTLQEGERFVLDAKLDSKAGTAEAVALLHSDIAADLNIGDVLLLGDGHVALTVEDIDGHRVGCRVTAGGVVSDRQGINRQGGGLSAGALTDKDRDDIAFAADQELDYVAVSFVRDAADVEQARQLLHDVGSGAHLIAKIERAEAVANIDSIVEVSDAIMVARGDLGVEMGYAELTGLQKRLIRLTRSCNRVVVTATQMMESMIHNPAPTRAEVSDVANAIMDFTDAVMLSGETAVGKYPLKAAQTIQRIARVTEKFLDKNKSMRRMATSTTDELVLTAAMTHSVNVIVNDISAKLVAVWSQTGSTIRLLSKERINVPILALSSSQRTCNQMSLHYGVIPRCQPVPKDIDQFTRMVEDQIISRKWAQIGDTIVLVVGQRIGIAGATNAVIVHTVGDKQPPH